MKNIHHHLITLTVLLALAGAGRAAAQATNEAPPVVVTATRLPAESVPLAAYPANVTVLDKPQLEASPSFTLPELLRQQVGLAPFDTVGFGQFANVMMRGFGERSGTLVLIDGVRANDAGDSTLPYLWNTIPMANLERVEVIRGGGSTIYGEGAIGGVINLITRRPSDQPVSISATGAGGNLGYYNGHVDVSGKVDVFDYYVSGDRQEWDGWRDSSAFRAWSASAKPSVETPIGRFTLSYAYHDETSENPGNLTRAEYQDDPRQKGANTFVFDNRLHRGALQYDKAFDNGLSVAGQFFGQEFTTDSTSAFGEGRIEQPNYGTTWQGTLAHDVFDMANTFTLGAEAIQQDFSSVFDSSFGAFETGADNWTASVFAQETLQVLKQLALTIGGRYDHRDWDVIVRDPFNPTINEDKTADVWSYKAVANWTPAEKVDAWLSASRSFRLPSGFDIGTAGSTPGELFFANPDIDPVDARTVEVGARCGKSAMLGGSLAYFYSWVNDDILFDPFTFQNDNFDSRRQGVELSLTSQPCPCVDFYYTTAWTDAQFDGGPYDGNRLPLVPEWQLTGGINWRPIKRLQLTLETVYVDGQVANNDVNNDFNANRYMVVNMRASYTWQHVKVFGAINNLFDRRYETFPTVTAGAPQEQRYNPAAGFSVQGGATVTF